MIKQTMISSSIMSLFLSNGLILQASAASENIRLPAIPRYIKYGCLRKTNDNALNDRIAKLETTTTRRSLVEITDGRDSFSKIRWLCDPCSRRIMLNDLISTNHIIGSDRLKILELLGSSEQLDGKPKLPDSANRGSDWYLLGDKGACGAAPKTYLEVIYRNGIAESFRYATVDTRGDKFR